MRLIAEEINNVDFLCEENEGKKNYFIEGIFLQAELKNRNNRMYPQKTLAREVAKYDENYIQKGRALGELGHPDGPSINLDRVSHKILSLREDGNNFIGKAKLLETPMGKVAKSLLDEGVKLFTNIINCDPKSVTIGMDVKVTFVQATNQIHVPMFEPL